MLGLAVTEPNPTFFQRLVLALVSFFRILADASFACKFTSLETRGDTVRARDPEPAKPTTAPRDLRPALQLLSLLQREGRLVDFVQQDILAFSDADVGAAARVVHEGCRRALQRVTELAPVRDEKEGHSVTVPQVSTRQRSCSPAMSRERRRFTAFYAIAVGAPRASLCPKSSVRQTLR